MKSFLPSFKALILDLFFPRICPHCSTLAEKECLVFCKTCFSEFKFTQREDRCRGCGKWKEGNDHCPHCQKSPSPFYQVLTAFDTHSLPALTLQRKYQNPAHYFLAKGAGALMALHYINNGLKWPDAIVPFSTKRLGFCPATELAKTIASIFEIPLASSDLEGKKILLVGDTLNSAFFEKGEALAEGNPQAIYGLTFYSYE